MPDIATIAAGLQALKTAIDLAKDLKNVDGIVKDAAAQLKLSELTSALAEVKMKLADAQEDILALRNERNNLQELLTFSEALEFREPFYYATNDATPYCPRCWESEKKAIHLVGPQNVMAGPRYDCPDCKTYYVSGEKLRIGHNKP